jgi:hypothetical protein
MIDCHDCRNPVSPNARVCPQCGSTFLAGPARVSRRGSRAHGAEQGNDQALIIAIAAGAAIGGFYGAETSPSFLQALFAVPLYALVGAIVGTSIAFAINITRTWL